MTSSFILPHSREALRECLNNLPKDRRYEVKVEEYHKKRSNDQNAKLHALLSDIAKQKQWDGEYMEIEDWKRLLTAGWMKATGRTVKLVRDIEGNGFVPIYQRTSKLSVVEMIELIEYVQAWAVDQGVHFYDSLKVEG